MYEMHVCLVLQLRIVLVRLLIVVCDFVFVCATSYLLLATLYFVVRLRIRVVRLHNIACGFLLCCATCFVCVTSQSHSNNTYDIAQPIKVSHTEMKSRTQNEVSHTNTKSQNAKQNAIAFTNTYSHRK